jgi:hypothetical protein
MHRQNSTVHGAAVRASLPLSPTMSKSKTNPPYPREPGL